MYKAIEKYYINDDTVFAIGHFAILWGMVEAKYFKKECNVKRLRSMEIVFDSDELTRYAESLRDTLKEYYQSIEDIKRFLCMRDKEKELSDTVTPFLTDTELDSKGMVYAALYICFRIRSNAFHGEKVFWLLDQQRIIFKSCADFLNRLLMEDGIVQIT